VDRLTVQSALHHQYHTIAHHCTSIALTNMNSNITPWKFHRRAAPQAMLHKVPALEASLLCRDSDPLACKLPCRRESSELTNNLAWKASRGFFFCVLRAGIEVWVLGCVGELARRAEGG
jgi:hypothetical protein